MSKVELNKKVKNFKLAATGEQNITLTSLKGQNVILYFYPKDSTPGCTQEGLDFQASLAKFKRQNTIILGISRDTIRSHEKFKDMQKYKFDLLSDEDESLCTQFDVIKMKNMYGKKVRGIERSTFLIDTNGKLRNEWRKVKVAGHVDDVLAAVKTLNKAK
ncbi:Thiol peroxidase, Bcp-type [hydrothermal vent metagenome]|uniref:thioredoxin-dependent peroxiredoxin n=1 Tax=hydrothermal vent metagenome TaxID=652676 RepID=A0A3B1B5H6_9ZZZZ